MLITRSPFSEKQTDLPETTFASTALLKRLDALLDDEELLEHVRADFARRYRLTIRHGRHSTPVEVILRLIAFKDLFNWSFQQTEVQVARTPLLCWFCRVDASHVPDDTTLMRWSHLIGPQTRQRINQCILGELLPSKIPIFPRDRV
jgi:IS5 family transposase